MYFKWGRVYFCGVIFCPPQLQLISQGWDTWFLRCLTATLCNLHRDTTPFYSHICQSVVLGRITQLTIIMALAHKFNQLKPIHIDWKWKRRRKVSLMLVILSLIFFAFASAFLGVNRWTSVTHLYMPSWGRISSAAKKRTFFFSWAPTITTSITKSGDDDNSDNSDPEPVSFIVPGLQFYLKSLIWCVMEKGLKVSVRSLFTLYQYQFFIERVQSGSTTITLYFTWLRYHTWFKLMVLNGWITWCFFPIHNIYYIHGGMW